MILRLIASLLLAVVPVLGAAQSPIPPGSRIYVEPFNSDKFELQPRLEIQLTKYGFRVVLDPERADYRAKWSYTHGASTYASFRLFDANGDLAYVGEGKNPGFGTIINKAGSTWGCLRRATAQLVANGRSVNEQRR